MARKLADETERDEVLRHKKKNERCEKETVAEG
jgi:hypothetical protein